MSSHTELTEVFVRLVVTVLALALLYLGSPLGDNCEESHESRDRNEIGAIVLLNDSAVSQGLRFYCSMGVRM